jgi:uncharacterized membrane protein YecN with MAPEG domain
MPTIRFKRCDSSHCRIDTKRRQAAQQLFRHQAVSAEFTKHRATGLIAIEHIPRALVWLVAVQSCGSAASATVHLQGLVGVAEQSDGRTTSREATGRAVTHAADWVAMS